MLQTVIVTVVAREAPKLPIVLKVWLCGRRQWSVINVGSFTLAGLVLASQMLCVHTPVLQMSGATTRRLTKTRNNTSIRT